MIKILSKLTHGCPDDCVAELAFRTLAIVEAGHSDAVGRGDAKMRQYRMTDAGTEYQLLLIDRVVIIEWSVVDKETIDQLLVTIGLHLVADIEIIPLEYVRMNNKYVYLFILFVNIKINCFTILLKRIGEIRFTR